MIDSKIYLEGITPEALSESLLDGFEQRIQRLVQTPEAKREYLTRKEVASRLSITLPTLHDWCKKKILNPYRIGNRVYFKSDELEQALKQINLPKKP